MNRVNFQTYDGTYKHFNNLEWTGAMGDAVFIMNYVHYRPGPFWIKDHNDNYARHYPGLVDYYPKSMAKMQDTPLPGDRAHELACCRFANWLWEEKKPIVRIQPKKPVIKKSGEFKVVVAQRESKGQTKEDMEKYIPDQATEVVNVAHQRFNGIDWLIQELASADYYIGSCTGPTWLAASLGIKSKMVAWESEDMKFINNVREWFDMQEGCEWIRIGVRKGKGGTPEDKVLDRKVRSAPPDKENIEEYYKNIIK
jgi:hypothetical protein